MNKKEISVWVENECDVSKFEVRIDGTISQFPLVGEALIYPTKEMVEHFKQDGSTDAKELKITIEEVLHYGDKGYATNTL